jgi:hypothetical protein
MSRVWPWPPSCCAPWAPSTSAPWRPLPVLWIRDSSGRWHTTQTNGYYPTKTTGEVILPMAIVPPLAAGTPWVDMFAAGQSAEISARLPLHWT